MASRGSLFNFLLLRSPLSSLFFVLPPHLPPALLLGSVFWCNWGGGGAQFSPTATSPESETSNQRCQQLTLCSAAPPTLERGPTLWTRVMIVWAPDTRIALISAKQRKAGAVKIHLYTDPAVTASTLPLFIVSVMMLEAMRAREAELEMWSFLFL